MLSEFKNQIKNPELSTKEIRLGIYFFSKSVFKARDIRITTDQSDYQVEKELENDNFQQWIDLNTNAKTIKIEVLSAYPGEELNGQNPFTECAMQEIKFFGKS